MQITCPGCGAQYEVADEAIPSGGRDVQCSACGHVWFVTGTALTDPPADSSEPEDEPPAPATDDDRPDETEATDPEPAPEPAAAPRRPALSPEVAAILREEAERERARREAERAAQEVVAQPDLGLEQAMEPVRRRVDEARAHMAELRAMPVQPEAPPEPEPPEDQQADRLDAPRGRERLPDIEEINASLRAATERAPAHVAEPVAPARPGGFRAGFLGVIALACLALAAYLGAPRIAASVPAAAPHLERYVAGVDGLRLWLDRQVQGLLPPENGAD